MEITLRKATRLVSQIDSKISELASKLTPSKNVFVEDATEDITRRLNETRDLYRSNLELVQKLYDARVTLRGLVGATNEQSGVNKLVTVLKGYESKLQLLANLIRYAGDEPRLSDRELGIRLNALRAKNSQAQVAINTYARSDNSDTAAFVALEQSDLDNLKELEKSLTKKSEVTHDQLERINNTVMVAVADDIVSVLTEAGVL